MFHMCECDITVSVKIIIITLLSIHRMNIHFAFKSVGKNTFKSHSNVLESDLEVFIDPIQIYNKLCSCKLPTAQNIK